jgi:transcriptional regulator with GAF, ATPase, and Fis domain
MPWRNLDLFNLLCIPPFGGGDVITGLVAEAVSYCEQKRAFHLIDPPSDWNSNATAVQQFTKESLSVHKFAPQEAAILHRQVVLTPELVQRLLEKHAGNVTHAAREAGKDRRVFGRLVKKYGLRQAS